MEQAADDLGDALTTSIPMVRLTGALSDLPD